MIVASPTLRYSLSVMEPITISPIESVPSKKWLWWSLPTALLAVAIAVGVWLVQTAKPGIPSGLADRRSEATRIIAEGNAIADTDLRSLSGLELSKDYAGAVGLLGEALRVNQEQAAKNAELVRVSGELKDLSREVKPAVVGDKAKTAFGLLDELARSQETYLAARKELFAAAKAYYADLAAKKPVGVPEELNMLAAAVTADLQKTVDLTKRFQKAIQEFDATLAAK